MNHEALITTLGTLMEAINATSQAHMRQIEGDQEAAVACLELAQDALGRGLVSYQLLAASRPAGEIKQRWTISDAEAAERLGFPFARSAPS